MNNAKVHNWCLKKTGIRVYTDSFVFGKFKIENILKIYVQFIAIQGIQFWAFRSKNYNFKGSISFQLKWVNLVKIKFSYEVTLPIIAFPIIIFYVKFPLKGLNHDLWFNDWNNFINPPFFFF